MSAVRSRTIDAGVIIALGVAVSIAPILWYGIVWPNESNPSHSLGDWLFLFAFEIVPFALAALLRGIGAMGRLAAAVATAIVVPLVVYGQYAGLNPNDSSSTAPIALVIMPIWAVVPVMLVWWLGVLVRGARAAVRWIRP